MTSPTGIPLESSVDAKNLPSPGARLKDISRKLAASEPVEAITVRAFLEWFGIQRRGYSKVREVRRALKRAGLITKPDFESAFIESPIHFKTLPSQKPTKRRRRGGRRAATPPAAVLEDPVMTGGTVADPTNRIGRLAAANNPPLSVKPEATIKEAVTLMLTNDFSQLPVMQSEFVVKGIISWQSIGSRLAIQKGGKYVRECMEPAHQISSDASIFAAIDTIIEHQYALVRNEENKIVGIVTTSDLSRQFGQLGEPFLLLGEIENHVRRLIDGKFTAAEVKSVVHDPQNNRVVETVADLQFGEYIRLLEEPKRWDKLALPVDRNVFVKNLERVRTIRNDVMHFDPDGIAEDDLDALRKFVQFLATLQALGAMA